MKMKLLKPTAFAVVIALGIIYALLHSYPSDPITHDGVSLTSNEPQIHPPQLKIVHADQQKEETLSIKNGNNESPEMEPPAPANRDNLTVEPPSEADDEIGMSDSVEIMEIELTGMLLDYDISDEKIDEILGKIRGDTESDLDTADFLPVPPADYLKRLKFMVRFIDQSEMNSEQLAMIVDDIFNPPLNAPRSHQF